MKSGPVLRLGVAEDGIGNFEFPLTVDCLHGGPVPSEVEELSRTDQPAQLVGGQVPLQTVESQGSHAANVDPRPNHGKNVGVSELGYGLLDIERPYSHGPMVPETPRQINLGTGLDTGRPRRTRSDRAAV